MARLGPTFTAVVVLASAPSAAVAAETDDATAARRRVAPYRAVEVSAVGVAQMLPRPSFGADAALVLGWSAFHLKLGGLGTWTPAFRVGEGEVTNTLAVGHVDLCAAREVFQHQIRMCLGGQGGAMFHRWRDMNEPHHGATPWFAGTLGGDYRYAITERVGVLFGVGVIVPVVGPYFTGRNNAGVASPLIFPGPVAGTLTLGTSIRW